MTIAAIWLRALLLVVFLPHGAQKLFGSFGSGGIDGTAEFFSDLRYRSPRLLAIVAGLTELGGAILVALGLLTPLATLGLAVVTLNAVLTLHRKNGFWSDDDGLEFPLALLAGILALAAIGPGTISLDHALGITWHAGQNAVGLAVAAAAVAVSAVTVTLGRHGAPAQP